MKTPRTQKVSGFHICDILDLKKDESLEISDSKNLDLISENSNDDITVKSESPVPESPEKSLSTSPVFKNSLLNDTFIHYQHLFQNPAVRPWLYMNHNCKYHHQITTSNTNQK
jgi:hypothetical protein